MSLSAIIIAVAKHKQDRIINRVTALDPTQPSLNTGRTNTSQANQNLQRSEIHNFL